MLTEYIQAAMRKATYNILEDGTYFGEIPGFQGVWADEESLDEESLEESLEECRRILQEVLEEWLLLPGKQRSA